MAPTESAEFAAAAGSASSVDERTLRTLLMRQPAAKELGLTDDAVPECDQVIRKDPAWTGMWRLSAVVFIPRYLPVLCKYCN